MKKYIYANGGSITGGEAISGIGSVFSAIPTPVTKIIGTVLQVGGGFLKKKEANDALERQKANETHASLLKEQMAMNNQNRMVYANGGPLNYQLTQYNTGNNHENNPNGGIPIGDKALVEEGETRGIGLTKDYIFSNRLKQKDKNKTFAELSKDIEKKYKGYENDRIALESKDRELSNLRNEQETLKMLNFIKQMKKLQKESPELVNQLLQQSQNQNQNQNSTIENQNIYATGGYLPDDPPIKPIVNDPNTFTYTNKVYPYADPTMGKPEDYLSKQTTWNLDYQNYVKNHPPATYGTAGDVSYMEQRLSPYDRYMLHKDDVKSNPVYTWKTTPGYSPKSEPILPEINTNPNVLQRTDQLDVWGNPIRENVNAISTYNQTLGNVNYSGAYDWSSPSFVQNAPNLFTANDYEAFKEYYKNATGKEYTESYENILAKLDEASNNIQDGKVHEGYGNTENATLPMLAGFLSTKTQPNNTSANTNITTDNPITVNNSTTDIPTITNNITTDSPPVSNNSIIDNSTTTDNPKVIRGGNPNYSDGSEVYDNNADEKFNGDSTDEYIGESYTDKYDKFTSSSSDEDTHSKDINWLDVAGSAIPNLLQAYGNYRIGKKLSYDKMRPSVYQPDYVDPTRASQEVKNAFALTKDKARQISTGSGNYMSNLIGITAQESENLSSVYSQYANANAGISNQANQFNAQQIQNASEVNSKINLAEEQDRAGLYQNAVRNIGGAAQNAFNTYMQEKRTSEQMAFSGGENFTTEYIGPWYNNKAVLVFRGGSGQQQYAYYIDPETGKEKFIEGNKSIRNEVRQKQLETSQNSYKNSFTFSNAKNEYKKQTGKELPSNYDFNYLAPYFSNGKWDFSQVKLN